MPPPPFPSRSHAALLALGLALGTVGCSRSIVPPVDASTDAAATETAACGSHCDAGNVCPASTPSLCASRCVDLQSDPQNCGACGTSCSPSERCRAGGCETVIVDSGMGMDANAAIDGVDAAEPPDEGGLPNHGFRTCAVAPSHGPFTASVVASIPSGSRDLAFDGHIGFVTGATEIVRYDGAGVGTPLAGTNVDRSIRSLRYLPNGDIAFVALDQTLRFYSATSMSLSTIADPGFSFLNGVAVDSAGAIFFSDTALSFSMPEIRRATRAGAVTDLTYAIPVPTGLALTPDGRRLFVGSAGRGVYYVDLAADGTILGSPVMYLNEPVNGYGLAFDECGNLYVSDTDRGRILRVALGGGTFEALAIGMPESGAFAPIGLAFGQPPYETDVLYFVDLSLSAVVQVPVRVPGAPIVHPP